MVYTDYDFYINQYLGTAIKEADFQRLALRASAFLDYYTKGKAAKRPNLDALKMACCALAEKYQEIETAQQAANKSLTSAMEISGGEVQSETVGSWSKSYRSAGDTASSVLKTIQDYQSELVSIARLYLSGTGLLYRGERCCCK